ncbi:hypothetical protein LUZ60_000812 [Juncus effusus]|nr:hypothetical protein LUZ60_000812 [Juncus effusus]
MDTCKIKLLKPKSDSTNSTTHKKTQNQNQNQNRNQNSIRNPSPRKPRLKEILSSNHHKPEPPARTPSTPPRFPSPNARTSRTPNSNPALSLPKRPHSAERRPSTPSSPSTPSTPISDTSAEARPAGRRAPPPESLWPSMRNLSSSFQLESSPVMKKKGSFTTGPSQRAPLTQSENTTPHSKMIDQHRWPSMRGGTVSSISMSKSVDLTDKINKVGSESGSSFLYSRGVSPKRSPKTENGISNRLLISQLSPNSMSKSVDLMDKSKRPVSSRGASPRRTVLSESTDLKDKIKRPVSRPASPLRTGINGTIPKNPVLDGTKRSVPVRGISPLRTAQNSTESALNDLPKRPPSSRGLPISQKFNQISSNSLSKSMDLGEKIKRPVSSSFRRNSTTEISSNYSNSLSKSVDLERLKRPVSSSGRSVESDRKSGPDPNPTRSQSLTRASRTVSSPLTGFGSKRVAKSPLRGRPSTPCGSSTSSSSSSGGSSRGGFASSSFTCSNFNSSCGISDARKGKKKGFSKMEELHELKLLHNRDLQWKFVNACVDDVHLSQKLISEGMLYGMWSELSLLRDSVAIKRLEVQQLRQETKLEFLLNDQIEYLDSWAGLEREHCGLLSNAIEALKACTLRLPVTGGAKADVLTVRNAVSSAVDIMQKMGSSIFLLLPKVENASSLVEELALISSKERAMLDQGRELVATVAKLQVQESSLKTQLVQLKQDGLKMDRTEETVPDLSI